MQYCPSAYDFRKTSYVAGDLVEVDLNVFECAGGHNNTEVHKYEQYCNVADERWLDDDEMVYWYGAWSFLHACYRTGTPTVSPSTASSGAPSGTPSSEPSVLPSRQGSAQPSIVASMEPSVQSSGKPSNVPSWMPSNYPSLTPTAGPTSVSLLCNRFMTGLTLD